MSGTAAHDVVQPQDDLSPRWRPADSVFGQTYHLLRWSMPVLLLWLAVAIAWAWLDSGVRLPMTSISAYYYTDVQTVFVGVLISLGVLLIIIQGRTPWEDALMNTAGALAPFVALLPTPVTKSDTCLAAYCTTEVLGDILPDNHELIGFNVKTVIPIWLVLCAYLARRALTMRGLGGHERASSTFSAVTAFGFGAVGLLLWFSDTRRDLFYDSAHLTSAGVMVAMLIASMAPFAAWIGPSRYAVLANRSRLLNNGFWVLFWLTLLLILAWAATWGIYALVDQHWDHKVLVVELVAICPFLAYWWMQGIALGKRDAADPDQQRLA